MSNLYFETLKLKHNYQQIIINLPWVNVIISAYQQIILT